MSRAIFRGMLKNWSACTPAVSQGRIGLAPAWISGGFLIAVSTAAVFFFRFKLFPVLFCVFFPRSEVFT